jgi:hypothetical protein
MWGGDDGILEKEAVVIAHRRFLFIASGPSLVAALLAGCTGSTPAASTSSTGAPSPVPTAAAATCDPFTDPDWPGPSDQGRPALQERTPAAMDVGSGTVLTFDGTHTWAFDVCTNTWRRANPVTELGTGVMSTWRLQFAYDADDAVVVALYGESARPIWVYSAAQNTWTQQPRIEPQASPDVWQLTHVAYDPRSGDVVFRDRGAGELWAYDVGRNAWSRWPHGDAYPHGDRNGHDLLVMDSRADQIIYTAWWVDHELEYQTWTYDVTGRSWTQRAAGPPLLNTGWGESGGEIAYDPVSARTMIFSDGLVAAYDATSDQWTTKPPGQGWPAAAYTEGTDFGSGPLARLGHSMVYDPLNQRTVVLGGTSRMPGKDGWQWQQLKDVWAYDLQTNTWIQLLAPESQLSMDTRSDSTDS